MSEENGPWLSDARITDCTLVLFVSRAPVSMHTLGYGACFKLSAFKKERDSRALFFSKE